MQIISWNHIKQQVCSQDHIQEASFCKKWLDTSDQNEPAGDVTCFYPNVNQNILYIKKVNENICFMCLESEVENWQRRAQTAAAQTYAKFHVWACLKMQRLLEVLENHSGTFFFYLFVFFFGLTMRSQGGRECWLVGMLEESSRNSSFVGVQRKFPPQLGGCQLVLRRRGISGGSLMCC